MTSPSFLPTLSGKNPSGISPNDRVYLRRQLGDGLLSFAMPFALFREMETSGAGSFLRRHTWQELLTAKESGRAADGREGKT